MKNKLFPILAVLSIAATSCQKDKKDDQVVSQKYVHKYGYAVSQEEWEARNYPGNVITTLKNGATVTATYENGVLHGPCTFTYPHSQIIEKYVLYNQNVPVKEIRYNISGMPTLETIKLSPHRHSRVEWYEDGVPKSVEEYANDELLEGQYFTVKNELESRVEHGKGTRVCRDAKGLLLYRDTLEAGYMTKRESFYPNGSPESIAFYQQNRLHGEKRTFTSMGEPLSVEEWVNGSLHGKASYFKNGTKHQEVTYLHGQKHGWELHFIDGTMISHQIPWDHDEKHGPETYFSSQEEKVIWHYAGKEVSQSKFEELTQLDEMISGAVNKQAAERS